MLETFPAIILGLTLSLELVIFLLLPSSLKAARLISYGSVALIMFASTTLFLNHFNIYSAILMFIGIFRSINISRIAIARMNVKELSGRYTRSAIWIGVLSIILIFSMLLDAPVPTIQLFLTASLIGALVLFITYIISVNRWHSNHPEEIILKTIPTVTVCVPARNETQDLPECIETILASTYPKLEVIVLDDCSHDKTPAIIKDYAHKGVRFIKGQEPRVGWIAKNQAMNKLFEESRGDVVVFCGVDVRMTTDSIQRIVELLDDGLDMISVLPLRHSSNEGSVFIQPIRYWWELAVPRVLGARPPVLSTLWAIKRDSLKKMGDFESYKKSVQPERHFAKRLKNAYKFIISGNRLGITSVKRPADQFDTALRTRYPQLKSRPENVFLVLLAEIIVFILPIFGLAYGLIESEVFIVILSVTTVLLLIVINVTISRLTVQKTWFVGLVSLPLLVGEDLYLMTRSMLAYEFGVVSWKERNICLPMLQVEKELPKL